MEGRGRHEASLRRGAIASVPKILRDFWPFLCSNPAEFDSQRRFCANLYDGAAAKPHAASPRAVQDPSASHKAPGLSDRLRQREDQSHPPEDQGGRGGRVRRIKAASKSVVLRVHAPSPWPWRRPFLREGGSVSHRRTAGQTPPAQSSQPSAEELRARSRTGTLKFRRNPWHWRDRTPANVP
jgi:hypothetical protein